MDFKLFKMILSTARLTVFEGEGDGGDSSTGSGDSGTGAGDGASDGGGSGSGLELTPAQQEKVNSLLAAEKRKYQANQANLTQEIEALKAKSQLTAGERTELDQRVEKLKEELLTKEQIATKKAEKTKRAHEEVVNSLTSDRDSWKKMYTSSTIQNALTGAAASEDAFNTQQIVAILGPHTTLEPVLNDEDQPTGKLAPVVRLQDKDKDGKSITLTLSPADAVKGLKDKAEYANLFKGTGVGGIGSNNQKKVGGKAGLKEIASSGSAAYRAARKDGTVSFN